MDGELADGHDTPRMRARRRDAVANRERIVEAAIELFVERGFAVPVTEIAEAAGVGVGTFYRSFPDRAALMDELGTRAYQLLDQLIHDIDAAGLVGLVAIRQYLLGALALGHRLVLPLHGAPAVTTPSAAQARARIDAGLGTYLQQARDAGAVVSDVNATDVILCSALLSRPLRGGPTIERALRRHIEMFIAGLGIVRHGIDDPVAQSEIEADFATPRMPPS
jgi:AcrR family transcriptional regulator